MDTPTTAQPGAQPASYVEEKVVFTVDQVGTFEAARLSGILYQQMLQKLYARARAILGPDYDISKGIPDDVDLPCRAVSTLEVIDIQPRDLVQPIVWSGWATSPDDVLFVVWRDYMKAKAVVSQADQQSKTDLKNSSGGTAT